MSHNRIKITRILQGRTMAQTIRIRGIKGQSRRAGNSGSRKDRMKVITPTKTRAASSWYRNHLGEHSTTATNKAVPLTKTIGRIAIIRCTKILATRRWATILITWVARRRKQPIFTFPFFENNWSSIWTRMIGSGWKVQQTLSSTY